MIQEERGCKRTGEDVAITRGHCDGRGEQSRSGGAKLETQEADRERREEWRARKRSRKTKDRSVRIIFSVFFFFFFLGKFSLPVLLFPPSAHISLVIQV